MIDTSSSLDDSVPKSCFKESTSFLNDYKFETDRSSYFEHESVSTIHEEPTEINKNDDKRINGIELDHATFSTDVTHFIDETRVLETSSSHADIDNREKYCKELFEDETVKESVFIQSDLSDSLVEVCNNNLAEENYANKESNSFNEICDSCDNDFLNLKDCSKIEAIDKSFYTICFDNNETKKKKELSKCKITSSVDSVFIGPKEINNDKSVIKSSLGNDGTVKVRCEVNVEKEAEKNIDSDINLTDSILCIEEKQRKEDHIELDKSSLKLSMENNNLAVSCMSMDLSILFKSNTDNSVTALESEKAAKILPRSASCCQEIFSTGVNLSSKMVDKYEKQSFNNDDETQSDAETSYESLGLIFNVSKLFKSEDTLPSEEKSFTETNSNIHNTEDSLNVSEISSLDSSWENLYREVSHSSIKEDISQTDDSLLTNAIMSDLSDQGSADRTLSDIRTDELDDKNSFVNSAKSFVHQLNGCTEEVDNNYGNNFLACFDEDTMKREIQEEGEQSFLSVSFPYQKGIEESGYEADVEVTEFNGTAFVSQFVSGSPPELPPVCIASNDNEKICVKKLLQQNIHNSSLRIADDDGDINVFSKEQRIANVDLTVISKSCSEDIEENTTNISEEQGFEQDKGGKKTALDGLDVAVASPGKDSSDEISSSLDEFLWLEALFNCEEYLSTDNSNHSFEGVINTSNENSACSPPDNNKSVKCYVSSASVLTRLPTIKESLPLDEVAIETDNEKY